MTAWHDWATSAERGRGFREKKGKGGSFAGEREEKGKNGVGGKHAKQRDVTPRNSKETNLSDAGGKTSGVLKNLKRENS